MPQRAIQLIASSALFALAACDIPPLPGDEADTGVPTPDVGDGLFDDTACADLGPDAFRCGGDPTGIWEVVEACPAMESYDPLAGTCPGISASGSADAAGTLVITSTGAYELTLTDRWLDASFAFPLSCYGGATEPCSGANFGGVCEVQGAACTCDVRVNQVPVEEVGEWFRFEESLAFRTSDYSTSGIFCRSDANTMRLIRLAPGADDGVTWGFVLRRIGDG